MCGHVSAPINPLGRVMQLGVAITPASNHTAKCCYALRSKHVACSWASGALTWSEIRRRAVRCERLAMVVMRLRPSHSSRRGACASKPSICECYRKAANRGTRIWLVRCDGWRWWWRVRVRGQVAAAPTAQQNLYTNNVAISFGKRHNCAVLHSPLRCTWRMRLEPSSRVVRAVRCVRQVMAGSLLAARYSSARGVVGGRAARASMDFNCHKGGVVWCGAVVSHRIWREG